MIEPEPLRQVDRTYVRVGRRKLLLLSCIFQGAIISG